MPLHGPLVFERLIAASGGLQTLHPTAAQAQLDQRCLSDLLPLSSLGDSSLYLFGRPQFALGLPGLGLRRKLAVPADVVLDQPVVGEQLSAAVGAGQGLGVGVVPVIVSKYYFFNMSPARYTVQITSFILQGFQWGKRKIL